MVSASMQCIRRARTDTAGMAGGWSTDTRRITSSQLGRRDRSCHRLLLRAHPHAYLKTPFFPPACTSTRLREVSASVALIAGNLETWSVPLLVRLSGDAQTRPVHPPCTDHLITPPSIILPVSSLVINHAIPRYRPHRAPRRPLRVRGAPPRDLRQVHLRLHRPAALSAFIPRPAQVKVEIGGQRHDQDDCRRCCTLFHERGTPVPLGGDVHGSGASGSVPPTPRN